MATSPASPPKFRTAAPDDQEKEDDLRYDLGNLAAFDTHPISLQDVNANGGISNINNFLIKHARDNAQLLYNQIFNLDSESSDVGRLVLLPESETPLPRFRPVPKPKPETKWEKFAKEKGIKNKKRERMLWDEEKKEWRPRYGYQRANDEMRDWAIEVGPNDNPYEDPFQARKVAKKERILKNKLKQLGNLERAAGTKVPHGLKANLSKDNGINLLKGNNSRNNTNSNGSKKMGKGIKRKSGLIGLGDRTNEALKDAQRSSASMGKFDNKLKHEKKMNRGGKRRKKLSVTNTIDDKTQARKILERVLMA
jgi:regulator of ribosome biosynthesis